MTIHHDIPFSEYLRWPEISQSVLKLGRKSMQHVKYALDNPDTTVTDAMILGSALHTIFLEPELAATKIAVWDGGVRRGKEWDAFRELHAGKYLLTANANEKLVGMMKSLRAHPAVRRWLSRIEGVEVSARGSWRGVPVKGRVDALSDDPLIDLKKVSGSDPMGSSPRKFRALGYHIQAAMYCRLFQRERFVLLTVEDEPPYFVRSFELDQSFIRSGTDEAEYLLDRVAECQATGIWGETSDEPEMIYDPQVQEDGYDRFVRTHSNKGDQPWD